MFILEERKYTWMDMYRIPYSCAPISTTAVTMQKIITAVVNVFQVVVVAEFLDASIELIENNSFNQKIFFWFGLMILLVSWKRISFSLGKLFTKNIELQGARQFREQIVVKSARIQYPLMEDESTKELINRLTYKVEFNLSEMLQRYLNFFAIYIPRIIGVLTIIAMKIWWLAVIVIFLTAPLIYLSVRGGKRIYSANQEALTYERRQRYLFDILTGREAVEERTLFGYTEKLNSRWHDEYKEGRKLEIKARLSYVGSVQGGSAITSFIASGICIIMIPITASGTLSIGLFISLCTAIYDIVNLMGWEMTRSVSQIARFGEYMKDLTIFASLPEETREEKEVVIPAFEKIEFRHVSFRYPNSDTYILKDFSMVMKKGVHYALVGENGAGKSTVIKLLTGFYREYDGEILYNDTELRAIPQEQWVRIFSCVFQDFARYAISIGENIMIGSRDKVYAVDNHDRCKKMTEILGLDKEIESLKYGYETKLGKLDIDSIDLSGGQWQRIAMARALVNEAEILVLDEPTSALDPLSESRLYDQFDKISRGRTTIFISHRLGSTKLADFIYVLQDGKITECGSYAELMRREGLYATMFKKQQGWYAEDAQ